MRVLRVIARLNVGGPARHVVWLSEGLAKDGVETLLVTGTVPPGEDDMSGFAAAHGVTPHVIPSMSRELSPRDAVSIWKLWRLMVRFRPDVVHTHTAKAGAVGRIAGLLYRVVSRGRSVFVHTFHGHVFHGYYSPLKTRMFLAIERALARFNTDRIVVLSEQQRREIHETYGIGRVEQFVVIPLGIESMSIDAQPHAPAVGIVGRIAPIKNHEMFLRVAERLRGEARFVVYGDGADRASLEQRARGAVEFLGTRDAPEIYAAIDALALTSRNEGTPLAIIEAMAAGVPVIATAVGGVVDLLGDVEETRDGFEIRERGITVPSDDDVAFAAGLRLLLHDVALRARVAGRSRAWVEKTHTKERLLADIIALYRESAHHRG
ncbi:MAG TPA: glycosyltransferase [Thermoanaerobaculia bacterium]|nr:glycosyltransferase [Thermoanaerobaculia bacterium]